MAHAIVGLIYVLYPKEGTLSVRAIGVVITVMLAGATQAVSQQQSEPAPNTRLEAFLAAKGSLVIKKLYPVGNIRGLTLEALVLLEPREESQKVKGLRAEITEYGRVSNTHSSFLDMDELAGLLQAVDYMDRLANQWKGQKRESYIEVVFVTRGNFKLGFYQKVDDQKIFASSGVIGKADFFGDPKELPKIREMLMLALDKLKEL